MNIGIDLGDARVTAVSVDDKGTVLSRASLPFAADNLAAVARDAYRALRAAAPDSLGVTLPFHRDDLPADVGTVLTDDAGTSPVPIGSGQAVALAETWCGAAQGARHVISFSIGEHVTAGILIDDRLLTGAHGYAGSVAWLTLNPVEREDYRRRGGLEAEVAAAGIVRRLVWRIKSGDTSTVIDRVNGDMARLTADDVIAAAREGDGVCLSVIRDTARYVGMAIANLATILDPEYIVLGGTISAAGDLMLDAVHTECARRLPAAQSDRVRIVLSSLGDEAGAIGAARAAMLPRR